MINMLEITKIRYGYTCQMTNEIKKKIVELEKLGITKEEIIKKINE